MERTTLSSPHLVKKCYSSLDHGQKVSQMVGRDKNFISLNNRKQITKNIKPPYKKEKPLDEK